MNKLHAKTDIPNNRLYIIIAGKLAKKNLDKLYTDIRFCISDLQPGFNVITDLSECTLAALSAVPIFQKITRYLIENRVGLVVRVVNQDNIVFKQLLNLTARMQGYKAVLVSTIEEAEAEILKAEGRGCLRFSLHKQVVEYLVNDERGSGYLVDISTSGCAVELANLQLSVGEEMLISIPFEESGNLLSSFNANAMVIQSDQDAFTVQFQDYDDDLREHLWKRLVHEAQSELKE